MSDLAIRVNDVSKIYKLYDRNRDRLMESLGLSKRKLYHEHYALSHLSFEVNKGETVGIIGTNGAGKSTILKIITGVLNPTLGDVEINGRISALLELGAGFNMEYSGIENIYLNATMIGFSREEIDKKLDDILEFADIGEFVNHPVKTYSSGMFVRLAFAVAINIEPEILIVDEALSVGDVFFQAKCFHKFEEFKEQGKTILFVSHDLSSIQKYCDRAILLNQGSKISEGTPIEIIDLYKRILVGQEPSTKLTENEEIDGDSSDIETNDSEREDANKSQKEAVDSTHLIQGHEGGWKEKFLINPDLQEYGDHKADIIDFAIIDDRGVFTDSLIKGNKFQIKMKIRANEKIVDPIVAFTIRDIRGTDVCGTNTMFENSDIGTVEKNEEVTVTFTQKLDIQGGQYLLCLGLTRFDKDDFHVYHRLYDVLNISVVSTKNTVGFYDMNSKIEVQR